MLSLLPPPLWLPVFYWWWGGAGVSGPSALWGIQGSGLLASPAMVLIGSSDGTTTHISFNKIQFSLFIRSPFASLLYMREEHLTYLQVPQPQ